MYAHIAGYWCSKALNVPWVANINDPWDYHLFPGSKITVSMLSRIVSFYWLRKTIREAGIITYPCHRLWKYHEKISRKRHDCHIIPHIGYRAINPNRSRSFNLVHAGKLGATELSGRPTNALIDGMAKFFIQYPEARNVTKLTLVGPKDESTQAMAQELGIEANIDAVGWVSYEESLRHIAAASVCILIENNSGEGIYLPSKITDYVAS